MKILGVSRIVFPSLCRRGALFLGCFVVVNLLTSLVVPGFDGNIWWIDLRWLPHPMQKAALFVFGATMLNYAIRPVWGRLERLATGVVAGVAVLVLIANSIGFYSLLTRGYVNSAWPVPVTLIVTIFLFATIVTLIRPRRAFIGFGRVFAGASLFAAGFTFLQMLAFGKTDYTRQGDVAVVFGARVYADGTLSDAVMDRVITGCRLYRDGYVRKLLFSGGPGDGIVHETEAMKRFALERGVPESAIILDRAGLNTRSTAQNTSKIFYEHGMQRVLAVSHFYHLPRVKLAYQHAGWEVFTVPAQSERVLLKLPVFIAREGVALLKYYFDPLLR